MEFEGTTTMICNWEDLELENSKEDQTVKCRFRSFKCINIAGRQKRIRKKIDPALQTQFFQQFPRSAAEKNSIHLPDSVS